MQLVQIFRFCLTFCFGCLLQLNIDLHSRFVSSITMCLICFWFLNWMLFDYSNSFCLLYFSRTKKKCVSAGCFLFLFLQLVIVTLWWLVLFAFIGFVLVLISGKECIFLCFWLNTSVTQLCCDILCVFFVWGWGGHWHMLCYLWLLWTIVYILWIVMFEKVKRNLSCSDLWGCEMIMFV